MKTEIMVGGWLMGTIKELDINAFEVRLANASKFDEREIFETFGEAAVFIDNLFIAMIDELSSDEIDD